MKNNLEIERRFLVKSKVDLGITPPPKILTQFYFVQEGMAIRLRFEDNIPESFDVKTVVGHGMNNELSAYFKPVSADYLVETLKAAGIPYVTKARYRVKGPDGHIWDFDNFLHPTVGLQIAEVELDHIDEALMLPEWAGEEITGLNEWSNRNLAMFGVPGRQKN